MTDRTPHLRQEVLPDESQTLDLSRPELAAIMQRYVARGPRRTPMSPPTALIVSCTPGTDGSLQETFEERGWSVERCGGPAARDCPIMRGGQCELRESVDTAVVYVNPRSGSSGGTLARIRCAADRSSPGVVALEGRLDPPVLSEGAVVAGAMAGPQAIFEAATGSVEDGMPSREDE